jgi:hypothetical protein
MKLIELTRTCIAFWTIGCGMTADPQGLDSSSTRTQPLEHMEIDAAERGCRGLADEEPLGLRWLLAGGTDLLLAPDALGVQLVINNRTDQPVSLLPGVTVHVPGTGDRLYTIAPTTVAPRAETELEVPLPAGVEPLEFPAQLAVTLRSRDLGTDVSPPALFFHKDARLGQLRVYDERGLVQRHRAGDLAGIARAGMSESERGELVLAGRGRPALPEDLHGDPSDKPRSVNHRGEE